LAMVRLGVPQVHLGRRLTQTPRRFGVVIAGRDAVFAVQLIDARVDTVAPEPRCCVCSLDLGVERWSDGCSYA